MIDDVLGERKSGMSNYKKIFCISVYKIITIITFCVLFISRRERFFMLITVRFMSVLQPAVRIAFLIILILHGYSSYVYCLFFYKKMLQKKSIIIATLISIYDVTLVYGIILIIFSHLVFHRMLIMYRILHFIWRRPENPSVCGCASCNGIFWIFTPTMILIH